MATVDDVCDALADKISLALYGANPGADDNAPGVGLPVSTVTGWPEKQQLDAAIKAGRAVVSIYPSEMEKIVSVLPGTPVEMGRDPKTLTLDLDDTGGMITVGGAQPDPWYPHNLLVRIAGAYSNITTEPGQGLAEIAQALLEEIEAEYPGAARVGPVITLPGLVAAGAARVGTQGRVLRPLRRVQRVFQIVSWCPSPAARRALVPLVDATLQLSKRLTAADGSVLTLTYRSSMPNDGAELQGIYRSDLFYEVDFTMTQEDEATEIVGVEANIREAGDVILKTQRA